MGRGLARAARESITLSTPWVQKASPATSDEPHTSPSAYVPQHVAFGEAWEESDWRQRPGPRAHTCSCTSVRRTDSLLSHSTGEMQSFLSGACAHLLGPGRKQDPQRRVPGSPAEPRNPTRALSEEVQKQTLSLPGLMLPTRHQNSLTASLHGTLRSVLRP